MNESSPPDSGNDISMILKSDFEILLDHLSRTPGVTARQLSTNLRKGGHTRFTSKLVNQVLYRLLAIQFVERDSSGDKPRWTTSSTLNSDTSQALTTRLVKRPLQTASANTISYRIADTEVRLLEDHNLSPNDPYIYPDWVGSHIVVSLNMTHPFLKMRLTNVTEYALFRLIVAVDAYVQWKIARLTEPPDATEVMNLRDYAFRFCTLESTEQPRND